MRNIRLTIEYDGTQYHGWQIQKTKHTVQQIVQDKLSKILNCQIKLHGSGRTDAGVHAMGQIAHFLTDSSMDLESLKKGLNCLLPPDIVANKVEEVAIDFHSRYSAKSRTYWYLIWNHAERSAFYERFSWHIITPLDISLMRQAALCLIGTHDFRSFQGADRYDVRAIREVKDIRIKKVRRHIILFEVRANAFLKHMVRNIVGTLVDVGKGKRTIKEFESILKNRDRTLAGRTAPARGLFLKEVEY